MAPTLMVRWQEAISILANLKHDSTLYSRYFHVISYQIGSVMGSEYKAQILEALKKEGASQACLTKISGWCDATRYTQMLQYSYDAAKREGRVREFLDTMELNLKTWRAEHEIEENAGATASS